MIEASGILRQETTLLGSKEVQKFLVQKKPTLLHITRELIENYLNDDLAKLGLLDNSIATHDTALIKLCADYGEYAGPYLYGLLVAKTRKSKISLVNEIHFHPRSLDRKVQKIVGSGIPLTLTDIEEPLPSLHVHLC
jgi:hypothetical protein